MIQDKKIFLFDMDGTLTPPREQVESGIVKALKRLAEHVKIGIVTGSDMDYVEQQMMRAFDIGGVPVSAVDILPCNGTKKYITTKANRFALESEANMIEEIGEEHYRSLIQFCCNAQSTIIVEHPEIPFSGTFVQYRGSLLNWCPVGRAADLGQREAFIRSDEKEDLRHRYAASMRSLIKERAIPVTVALGGSTSLDIYPNGWDKTYALRHYPGWEVYFAGDRCEKGGNDWHLYEALKDLGRSFHIKTTEETIDVIDNFISSLS